MEQKWSPDAAAAAGEAELFVDDCGPGICSPVCSDGGALHYASSRSGNVFKVSGNGKTACIGNTQGVPNGIVLSEDGAVIVADGAHRAVVEVDRETGEVIPLVNMYEDIPFQGPNAIAMDSDGSIYFTDSGAMGETTLQSPTGSCYCIENTSEGQMLKPLIVQSLASPCGIALSKDRANQTIVYLCEMAKNRIVRLVQNPPGVFHSTIFMQLAGRMGPSAICCDAKGFIYIAHYELLNICDEGLILCVSPQGKIVREFYVPAPQISGMTVSRDEWLYITEDSSCAVYRVQLESSNAQWEVKRSGVEQYEVQGL